MDAISTLNQILTLTLATLSAVANTVYNLPWSRSVAFISRVVTFPIELAWVPVSYIFGVLRVVFAPVGYIFMYITSFCRQIWLVFISLQPLYTFFGTAAAVGVVAGLTLSASSSLITSFLGMQDDPYDESRTAPTAKKQLQPYSSSLAFVKDESSSNEADWYWPEPSPSRRRPVTGLLSQTIMEEDGDSDI